MNQKSEKIIAAAVNLLVVLASFEGLIAILNLNQPVLFVRTAFIVGLFYIFQVVLLYDLHFKSGGILEKARLKHEGITHWFLRGLKIFGSAFWERFSHLRDWQFVKQWLFYLMMPGIVFWSSIMLFYVNFGFSRNQQIIVVLSSVALFLNYWYIKQIFERKQEAVDPDIFVVLSIVKAYASVIMYGAALAFVRNDCFDERLLILGTFCLTFLLIYQALFQHRLNNIKNLAITLLFSAVMAYASYLILVFWGYNYFTAAVTLGVLHNLLWGVFHYYLDKTLSWHAFWEILLISAVIVAMVFGITNFKGRLINGCNYNFRALPISFSQAQRP